MAIKVNVEKEVKRSESERVNQFLGPRGPLVLPLVGSFVRPVPSVPQENLDHLYTGIYAL